MLIKSLQLKRALRSALLVLLLCVAGIGNASAGIVYAIVDGQIMKFDVTDEENHYAEYLSGVSISGGVATIPSTFTYNNVEYTVTGIGAGAFKNTTNLTTVNIPNTVTYIGNTAFYKCSNLESISLPDGVTSIGNGAFFYCSKLASIEFPESLTFIDASAFSNCSSLSSINIPEALTYIGAAAFRNTGITSIDIPNSVEYLGDAAFDMCFLLTSVTLPNSMTAVGNSMFSNCTALSSVTFEGAIESIGEGAFDGCSSLTSFTFPNTLVSIGGSSFYGTGLTSINIPAFLTSIGERAFNYCPLEQITVAVGNTVYDSRDDCNALIETATNTLIQGCNNTAIPNSVTAIGESAFNGCSGLTSIALPSELVSIGAYAFQNTGLTSVTIPNSVTSIGDLAFSRCSNLESITLGSAVETIGGMAFAYCSNLATFTSLNLVPPTFVGDYAEFVFYSTPYFDIYVPYESLSAYQTAEYWSSYASKMQPMAYKSIPAHGENDGWAFIASPLVTEDLAPTAVENMIPSNGNYDLYYFNQSENLEWRNYKANIYDFAITNGQGYLYANAEDVNVIFKGEFNEDDTKEVDLVYDADAEFAGWNLVGNPFPVSAYANRSYYTMNEDGTGIEPNAVSSATLIPVCTGIMVMAEAEGETVVFSTEEPVSAPDKGCLQITLSQIVEPVETPDNRDGGPSTGSGTLLDKAIVSFNAGDRLEKFVFNKDNARISIPQGGKDYAIATVGRDGVHTVSTEVPLNFKATKNGQYTITVNAEEVVLDYLHLIDNLTGADVDLLDTPAYTFNAKTTDYASRFRLVFSSSEMDGPSTGSGTFAFINNGEIVITGVETCHGASLQIVDVTGRILVNTDVARNVSTSGMAPGVYVLRLINGDDVKTQKIVIE